MALKIISGIFILVTVYLNFKHGWSGITGDMSPEETKMMSDIGIGKSWFLPVGIVSFAMLMEADLKGLKSLIVDPAK